MKDLEGFSQERLIRFACDCALVNIELIKPYTDEYDLIVEWLKNPNLDSYGYVYSSIYIAANEVCDGAMTIRAAIATIMNATTAYIDYYAVDVAYTNAYTAKAAGNSERIDALIEELTNDKT